MKELPVKVRVVEAQMGMEGKYGVVIVVEGFEKKSEAKEHAKYLGEVVSGAGLFRDEMQAQSDAMEAEMEKPKPIIKLL